VRKYLAAACACATLTLGGCGKKSEVVEGFPPSFAGVGMELAIVKGWPVVQKPVPGGPADTAGVKVGDRVTTIDGVPTEGHTLGDIVMKLRGKPDSQVTLEVDRGGRRIIIVVKRRQMTKGAEGYRAAK
jgi:C-terminal processing protease CtpA/Prc